MTKLMFLCDWGESPEDLLNRYRNQTPGCAGVWKDIQGTSTKSEADIFVILDGLEDGMDVDLDRTLFVTREPRFIKEQDTSRFQHVIDWAETNCGITWWLSKSYDELLAMEYPSKPNLASCVMSSKHEHRNLFLRSLYKKRLWAPWRESAAMDLYGRGHVRRHFGDHYRGPIESNGNCKWPGLESYRYTLVLENSQQHNYWTEKLADAYLAWCVPMYWGCPNLGDYFDEESFYSVSLEVSVDRINEIISQPVDQAMVDRLQKAREDILNEFNIWEVIRKKIKVL